ncbi:hypothetical protein, partial [Azotobacter chroococcum]|uniref:hypothetical protein n=1 Tax=Azotobacter chroococcum TaxID=353 RepID=UPI001B8B6793
FPASLASNYRRISDLLLGALCRSAPAQRRPKPASLTSGNERPRVDNDTFRKQTLNVPELSGA